MVTPPTKTIPVEKPHADSRDIRPEDTKDGAEGFSPQYSGNGIEGKSNTSSFDIEAGTEDGTIRPGGSGPIK